MSAGTSVNSNGSSVTYTSAIAALGEVKGTISEVVVTEVRLRSWYILIPKPVLTLHLLIALVATVLGLHLLASNTYIFK